MAAKSPKRGNKKAAPAPSLPPGLKPSTRKIPPKLRQMIEEDRAIASGGRNIVHRQPAATR